MRSFITTARRTMLAVLKRPEGLLVVTFGLLILVGSVLLALPMAHADGKVGPLDALFTSTSAVCVTGLVVVDTGKDFKPFGQVVILALIQLGGLGIMAFAALVAQMLRRRISFRSQALIGDVFYQREAAGAIKEDLRRIVALTFVLEFVGAWLLYLDFRQSPAEHPPLFSAAFHAVSAFCNAGFSLNSDSLMLYRSHTSTIVTFMALIVLGGLGHTVVLEAVRRVGRGMLRRDSRPVQWSLNSRVVLTSSAGLIALGAISLFAFGVADREQSWWQAMPDALFQSVTARTAGFNTVEICGLPMASLLVLIGLMFVGGSPGSCAGGIKTTSIAVGFAYLRSQIRSMRDVVLLGRRVPQDVATRAALICGLALSWNALGCVILSATEPAGDGTSFESLLFEQVSAFGTVGLSTGITAGLSATSKLWIIATMFVGRLGPLTMALIVMPAKSGAIRYPEERLMIG